MEKKLSYNKNYWIFNSRNINKNKRGVSAIIVTVILVALVMTAGAVVWAMVNNLIKGQTEGAESCLNVLNKVTINGLYTCYDKTGNNVHFSINIGDVDIDEVVVVISSAGATKSYTLTNYDQTIPGLGPYPSGSGSVKLPEKNGGKTYIASGFTEGPDSIRIAPIIAGKQCDTSDEMFQIENCI